MVIWKIHEKRKRNENCGTSVVFYLGVFEYLSCKLSYSKQLY